LAAAAAAYARHGMTTTRPGPLAAAPIRTPRLDLLPLRPADAGEMVVVLADPALYAFTGGEPPSVESLRRRYALQVVGQSPDGTETWLNWIVRRREAGD